MPVKYDPERHHRRSIRLKGYDYSQPGAYFITIVTQNRECLFGEIMDGQIRLNDAGRMIERWWLELNHKFPTIHTDVYVVMPNHFHGIVIVVGADLRVRPDEDASRWNAHSGGTHAGVPLPAVVQWFKTMTTNEYIRGVKTLGWPPFPRRLWQRNYYEHIIRNDQEWDRIRTYIANNPLHWERDRENPSVGLSRMR
ncbi:MAG TPA: hypothetical protein G4O02_07405 [Caldilineae bacterium]|nr:hypothetical protein [Caldilineae bacterium]